MSSLRMMRAALLLVGLLCPLAAQTQDPQKSEENRRFIVFIHAGGDPGGQAQRVAVALGRAGFVVRRPDNERDRVGGPGIDYFNAQDAAGAARAARIVDATLSRSPPVQPRFQSATKNPSGYLGVWLF